MIVMSDLAGTPPAAVQPSVLRVEVLRHFRLTLNGTVLDLGHTGERLVAFLALEDRSPTRDQVAAELWPEARQSQAAASLRRALSIVRRCVPGLVRREANRLALTSEVSVDARAQRDLIDAITTGEQCTADGHELRLLRGDLLPDWDELWLGTVRQELRLLRLLSLEAVAATALAERRPGAALATALAAVHDEPLRESAHRLVIEAHLAQGNQAAAAQQYWRYRDQLWDDLRILPSAAMENLVQGLRDGDLPTRMLIAH